MNAGDVQPGAGAGADAWAVLWRTGILHSCCASIHGNYDGAIADFWDGQFARLGAGATVVDIGTGNGAVPLLAARHAMARGIEFDIHGCDLADIDPVRWVPDGQSLYAGIRFHPGTPAAALPFADGSASLLTSQYAFEYSHPRGATVAEIVRVVRRPLGRVAMVVHSRDSVIARVAGLQADACALLLDELQIFDRAARMVEVIGQVCRNRSGEARSPGPEAEQARHAFNEATGRLFDHLDAVPEAMVLDKAVYWIRGALQLAETDPAAAMDHLQRGSDDIHGERVRLADLQAAIMDPAALAQVQGLLLEGGFARVDVAPLDRAGVRMGWTVQAGDGCD